MTLRQYSHWILRTLGSPSMKYSIKVSWFSRSHCSVVIGILLWLLRIYGSYQNGNSQFCTIKRYDYLVAGQNSHQPNLLCYCWVVSGQFVHLPLFTVTHKAFLANDALCHSPHQLAILASWYWVCRSPCMDFLPPSGGVFRLALTGSSPGIPCRRSFSFQGSVPDLAIKNRHTTTWIWPSLPGWPWFGFVM